jgi:hypothetical protein
MLHTDFTISAWPIWAFLAFECQTSHLQEKLLTIGTAAPMNVERARQAVAEPPRDFKKLLNNQGVV